jgi:hypothetical protein
MFSKPFDRSNAAATIDRTVDTVRPPPPASGTQPIATRSLSIVERHVIEPFTCTDDACVRNADVFVRCPVGQLTVVVLLCRQCAMFLPPELHAIPIAKGGG